jgi:hypothetical protein
MKAREPHIPLFLWVATAALVHILWGGGADQIAAVFEDQSSLARLAASVRSHVYNQNKRLEVTLLDVGENEPTPMAAAPLPSAEPTDVPPVEPPTDDPLKAEKIDDPTAPPDKAQPDKATPAKPEPNKSKTTDKASTKPEEKPPETKKPDPKKLPDEQAPLPPQVMRRTSVRQHVEDKNQKDNPNAKNQADEANWVDKETQARITSTDQDDPNPTPGQTYRGPAELAGNAAMSELGQSESAPGNPDDAPATSNQDGHDKAEQQKAKAQTAQNPTTAVYGEAASGGPEQTSNLPLPAVAQQRAPSPGQQAQSEQEAREAVQEVLTTEGDSFPKVALAQQAQAARKARRAKAATKGQYGGPAFGGPLNGRTGLTPGGLNPNLTPLAALESVGSEQLMRERIADGERRRSTHRGSWQAVGLERWRSAIENYVAVARDGNTTALNAAHAPFASYLNNIHNRIHPVFAERFLVSLDGLPSDHPANRPETSTHIEMVLSPEDGRIVRMGVTKASGTTVFDVNALEAVQKSSPFGAAPPSIVSPDGHVYLHWEFHRDPNLACHTYFARPLMLKAAPKTAPPVIPYRQPRPEEHGFNHATAPKATP